MSRVIVVTGAVGALGSALSRHLVGRGYRVAGVGLRRHEERLVRGYQSPQFESFHLFQNRPGASPSGLVVVSSKRGGLDCLHVIDARRRRVLRLHQCADSCWRESPASPGYRRSPLQ